MIQSEDPNRLHMMALALWQAYFPGLDLPEGCDSKVAPFTTQIDSGKIDPSKLRSPGGFLLKWNPPEESTETGQGSTQRSGGVWEGALPPGTKIRINVGRYKGQDFLIEEPGCLRIAPMDSVPGPLVRIELANGNMSVIETYNL